MASFKKEFGLVNSKISNASRYLKDLLKYLQNVMTPGEAEKIGGKRQLLIPWAKCKKKKCNNNIYYKVILNNITLIFH